jgi:PAS domain S-box-containing protein
MNTNNQNSNLFSKLCETMRDAFVSTNLQGLILECNNEYLGMLGYDRNEISRITYQQITPSKWHTYEEEIVHTKVLTRGYSDVYEKEYIRKDGTIFPVELRAVLVRDDQGHPSEMWAFIRDITERKKTEQALRNSEGMNHAIQNSSPASIILLNQEMEILTINEAGAQRFGRSVQDLVGRNITDFLPPDVTENRKQVILDAIHKRQAARHEDYRQGIWFESTYHPIYDENGQFKWVVIIADDITYRKKAHEALRDSEQRYRSLADTAEDSIFIIDKNDTILYVNPYAVRFLGKQIDQIIGKKRSEIVRQDPNGKRKYNNIQRAIRTGVPSIHEDITPTPAGNTWLSTRLVPLKDAQGNNYAVLGVARDISDRKRDEKALIRARNTLEKRVARRTSELQAMQEQLRNLADKVISAQEEERRRVSRELHDDASQMLVSLRYNLAALLEMNAVSKNPSTSERLSTALGSVDLIIDHIRNLAHSLRPPALDVGGLHISLKEFCREFTENTKIAVEYKGENISYLPLEISISLFRFVQEALTNVVKHAHASRVRVSMTCRRNEIVLTISDNGHGIRTGNNSRGTGLLGIEERINLVGGTLKVRSITGVGVALKARIPWDSLGHP